MRVPRSTIQHKLKFLLETGIIVRVGQYYYLESARTLHPPEERLRRFAEALARAATDLDPWLGDYMSKGSPKAAKDHEVRWRAELDRVTNAIAELVTATQCLEKRLRAGEK
jgi:hypothetical protein